MNNLTLVKIIEIMNGPNLYVRVLPDKAVWVESGKKDFTPDELYFLRANGCVFNEDHPDRLIIPAKLLQ